MANQIPPQRKNYQWPCSCLTQVEMEILYRLRKETGRPINQLIKEAIQKLCSQSTEVESSSSGLAASTLSEAVR